MARADYLVLQQAKLNHTQTCVPSILGHLRTYTCTRTYKPLSLFYVYVICFMLRASLNFTVKTTIPVYTGRLQGIIILVLSVILWPNVIVINYALHSEVVLKRKMNAHFHSHL